jgi:mono/diheme cytochrome c family protein
MSPDHVLNFEALYSRNCAGCHGSDGKLGPAPPLNDPIFLAIIPDEELLHVIADGRHGTPMPAFARDRGGPLSAAQVKALVEGLKPRWRAPEPSPDPVLPYSRAEDKAGDRGRGSKVFARACAGCHGNRGQGGEYDGQPVGALNDPAFLALISDQALRRFAITGRPDLGMPHFAGTAGRPPDFKPLTSEEIEDLVAHLAYWRQGGAANGQ